MIEIIYKTKGEQTQEAFAVKTPKNVKQIGIVDEYRKVYVEDYVMNYLKKPPMSENCVKYGVLLGESRHGANHLYVFVKGIVESIVRENAVSFNEAAWNRIYSDMKSYYPNQSIVGWYLSIPYRVKGDWELLKKMHLDNFAGDEKICFFMDRSEHNEGFYAYEEGKMVNIGGYYIYYEKNEQLQQYFYEKNRCNLNQDELKLPDTTENGKVMREGSFRQYLNKKNRKSVWSYITVTISVAVVAAGITAISKYSDIRNLSKDMEKIMQATKGYAGFSKTQVEKVNGNVTAQTTTTVDEKTDSEKERKETGQTKKQQTEQQQTENQTVETQQSGETQSLKQTESSTASQATVASEASNNVTNEVSYYTVKKGETLFQICIKIYNDANMLEQLKLANNLDDSCNLTEGQKIILP